MSDISNQSYYSRATAGVREIVLHALGILVAENLVPAEPLHDFVIETPANARHGDFSCNVCLVSSKALKTNPRALADLIVKHTSLTGTLFDKIEVAGPGFLNFFLGNAWYSGVVAAGVAAGNDYGRVNDGAGKRVLVEFVSANPTGPMHIGNARGGAFGDSLVNILQFAGYEAEREFYVNDAGNQINKFAVSLETRYLQLCGQDIQMPEDAYQGQDITDHAAAFIKDCGQDLLPLSAEERQQKLVTFALPRNLQTLHDDLLRYGITYDTWFRESSLHDSGAVEQILTLLKETGNIYEADGATWLKAGDFGAEKDVVLIRANGVPTYIVPDIAYHYNKLVTRKFDIAVDLLGADHHGYVPRMNAALDALGVGHDRLKAIVFQMVSLVHQAEDGSKEVIKLSKRSGKAITLATLLDAVPLDAARFFFNLRDANTQLEFDLDLAVEESAKNPVYYVQYAHARICRLLEKLSCEDTARDGKLVYTEPGETALIRKIAAFPEEVRDAARDMAPSRITRYTGELAAAFHKFYDSCPIKGADREVLHARLELCLAARITLANALRLLGVAAPEKM